MKKYTLFLFCFALLFITACSDKSKNNEHNTGEINESLYAFSFDMMNELEETRNHENILISPASIFMALTMLQHGADGETKEEIKQTLRVTDFDDAEIRKSIKAFLTKLDEKSSGVDLKIANAIWLDEHYHIQEAFKSTLEEDLQSKIVEIDASNPASADLMNEWVEEQTNGKIDKMVESPLSEDFVSLLINAVYFKGDWTFPFHEDLTEEKDFTLQNDTTIQAPMMTLNEKLEYSKQNQYEAVRLPYGEDGNMSMYLFLPEEGIDLKEIQKELSNQSMEMMKDTLKEKEGTVVLPKFTLKDEIELDEILIALGMKSPFDTEEANLTNMIEEDEPLWVSKVKHKTNLDIDEKGTEAAGATSVEIETTSAPLEEPFMMEFNHPFHIMIVDDTTNTLLFTGNVYELNISN